MINKINYSRPICCSIAGYDPTGGAGILADIKIFQKNEVIGFGVITGQTIQTENLFLEVIWNSLEFIINQLEPLLETYHIQYFKIGLMESFDILEQLLYYIHLKVENPIIIWDTVLKSSSGFAFLIEKDKEKLERILSKVYLITPNYEELQFLDGGNQYRFMFSTWMSEFTNVLCKSFVDAEFQDNVICDILNIKSEEYKSRTKILKKTKFQVSKHGTGCMMSSFLLSKIAKGISLELAFYESQEFMEKILTSNENRLADLD